MLKRLIPLLITLALVGCAGAQVAVRSGLTQIHRVVDGDRVSGAIVVENLGDDETRVRIYQTDYLFQAGGSIDYADPGSAERSNALWLHLNQSELTLPPGARSDVTYVVEVPPGDRSGSYWSMIMIEEIAARYEGADGMAISTLVRYGVQIVSEFAGGEPLLEFVDPELLDGDAGTVALQVDAVNTGEVLLRSDYYLQLFDSAGNLVLRVDGERQRTYPGTSVRQTFDLGRPLAGDYTALIVADAGEDRLFGAQYQLELDGNE